jgi:HSP20 family protein
MNLIPWKKKTRNTNGGDASLATIQDFPSVLRRMRNEFDELYSQFSKNWPALESPAGIESFGNGWNWGITMTDEENQVSIRAEAPGFEPDDFDIRVSGDRLVIRAAHKKTSKSKGYDYQEQSECFESMTLPPGVDPTKVEAKYKNGVLTLQLPKTKEGKGQRISVKGV